MLKDEDTEEQRPPSALCDPEEVATYYFESPSAMNFLMAGGVAKNLKRVENAFHVKCTARDNFIKISAGTSENISRTQKFFDALKNLRQVNGSAFDIRDFDQILHAYAENRENTLRDYFNERIKVGPTRREIVPRTPNQLLYVRAIRENDVTFGTGPAGTGKTYLAMALAVSALLEGSCSRLILTRPAVEAGENLGFLPGTLQDKINPYLRPLFDALYDMLAPEAASDLMDRNIIEVAPLAFMRGRTLNNAFIILDEAQNTTNEQMLMLLTRLGFGSKCVICGDPTQTDLAKNSSSGLATALNRLKNIEDISTIRFTSRDVVRHCLVEKIIDAWSANSEPENKENQDHEQRPRE